ncbi:hypothetical protein J3D48_000605 [Pseudomonas fluorescens]|jgi:hypothetical protein|nr:hypothetical protein [Pseudomonas fluorescens]
MIVPTLRVGMPHWTLCVRFRGDAERPGLRSHAERGNDHEKIAAFGSSCIGSTYIL